MSASKLTVRNTDPARLFALLTRVIAMVATGTCAAACCEVTSLGWARYRPPSSDFAVKALPPSLHARAQLEDGWFDEDTCQAACETPRCAPITLALPPGESPPPRPDERFVLCRYDIPGGCSSNIPSGRVPHHLKPSGRVLDSVGDYFARAAELEAAAAVAFRLLARELEAFDTPRALRSWARRAAVDEVRHARSMRRQARRFGGRRRALSFSPPRRRSLVELLLENASEGCAGETLGALLALHQSVRADDAGIRTAMAEIARDETDHAALAWSLYAELCPRLTASERSAVDEAMRAAFARHALGYGLPEDVQRAVGLPERAHLAEMVRVLAEDALAS